MKNETDLFGSDRRGVVDRRKVLKHYATENKGGGCVRQRQMVSMAFELYARRGSGIRFSKV